jgi:hypothetical protein
MAEPRRAGGTKSRLDVKLLQSMAGRAEKMPFNLMERVRRIPKFLVHPKTYSGYPIPFTQSVDLGQARFQQPFLRRQASKGVADQGNHEAP